MENGGWKVDDGEWKTDDGRWKTGTSVEGFPSRHQGPEHRADLLVTGSEPFVFLDRDVLTIEGEIKPQLRLLRFAQGIIQRVLEDLSIAPLGESLHDVSTHSAG